MRITRFNGPVYSDGNVLPGEKIEAIFEADAAILAGDVVALDAANTTGILVVAASDTQHAVGVYEGEGGTGAAAGTGFTGNAAVDGDRIVVTIYGVATAQVAGDTTAVTDGLELTVEGSGELGGVTDTPHDFAHAPFIALEANASTVAAKKVFVRCM